jgi:hypothetical protein
MIHSNTAAISHHRTASETDRDVYLKRVPLALCPHLLELRLQFILRKFLKKIQIRFPSFFSRI